MFRTRLNQTKENKNIVSTLFRTRYLRVCSSNKLLGIDFENFFCHFLVFAYGGVDIERDMRDREKILFFRVFDLLSR